MENNLVQAQSKNKNRALMTPETLLTHWQGHRNLTRKVIESFPEDKLFSFSVSGMRSFAGLTKEIMELSGYGIRGIATGEWTTIAELEDHSDADANTKEGLLRLWDKTTNDIKEYWQRIPDNQFHEVIKAFGAYEGEVISLVFYWIDNEIHHRAQGYVYLRALGIEPPGFWDRE